MRSPGGEVGAPHEKKLFQGTPTSPPNPLSSSALLRNAAWRGGAREEARSDSPSPRSEAELERGLGG